MDEEIQTIFLSGKRFDPTKKDVQPQLIKSE